MRSKSPIIFASVIQIVASAPTGGAAQRTQTAMAQEMRDRRRIPRQQQSHPAFAPVPRTRLSRTPGRSESLPQSRCPHHAEMSGTALQPSRPRARRTRPHHRYFPLLAIKTMEQRNHQGLANTGNLELPARACRRPSFHPRLPLRACPRTIKKATLCGRVGAGIECGSRSALYSPSPPQEDGCPNG